MNGWVRCPPLPFHLGFPKYEKKVNDGNFRKFRMYENGTMECTPRLEEKKQEKQKKREARKWRKSRKLAKVKKEKKMKGYTKLKFRKY
jgi:hypothetical protein